LYLVTTSWELRSNSFSSLFSSSDIATPHFLPCNPLPRRKKGRKTEKNRREIHSEDEKGGQKKLNRKTKTVRGTDESFVQQAGKTTKPGGAQNWCATLEALSTTQMENVCVEQ
jgi:hypothetical protein